MITVENLAKSFNGRAGSVRVLDAVTFGVGESTICGVLGAAGSGKSTLARCVALRERPDHGAVRVDGTDIVAMAAAGSSRVGFADVDPVLSGGRTVAGIVAHPLDRAGVSGPNRRAAVAELLDLVGLTGWAATGVDTLEEGLRRRVAVARALVSRPSVLVVDGPTDGVDARARAGVLTVLDRARSELGVSVLVTTSDVDAVRKVCDEVALLEAGKIVEHGNLLALATDPHSRTTSVALPAVPRTGRADHDRVVEVVLVGFAAVGALLPEALARFDVDIAVLGGRQVRLGDTPVARFAIGVTGERADSALAWIAEQGGTLRYDATKRWALAA